MVRRIARAQPTFFEEDIEEILGLIRASLYSGQLSNGPLAREFEAAFATQVGVQHAVAVSSGTAALEIALRAIGVEGREVILPTETFVASANAILAAGGKPVFAEIRPDTYCLDLADVERKIGSDTAAVMIVHMAGLVTPDIADFQLLCRRRGLALVEDAAHAHGATSLAGAAGALGRVGCFSFYPTKLITTGEGGMITTDDPAIATRARSLRNHGATSGGPDYSETATNMRMAEPLAAIGLVQVKRLREFVWVRNLIAARYQERLARVAGIRPLPIHPGRHSYWNYLVTMDEGIGVARPEIARRVLETHGVEVAWPYDPPCHLQPVFQRILGTRRGDLPESERLLARHLALPMHSGLSLADADLVIESLAAAMRSPALA